MAYFQQGTNLTPTNHDRFLASLDLFCKKQLIKTKQSPSHPPLKAAGVFGRRDVRMATHVPS